MRTLVAFLVLCLVGLVPAVGQVYAVPDAALPDQAYAGLAQGDDFLISVPGTDKHGTPAVAYNDDDDQYLVVWADNRAAVQPDIFGQLFSADGVPLGDNLVIQTEASHSLIMPDVAYDTATGFYLVVWQDATSYDIEGRVVKYDGTIPWASFPVADGTAAMPRSVPAVACYPHLTSGMCVVAYERGSDGAYDIYSRRVTSAGAVQGAETPVATGAGEQVTPDVAANPEAGVADFQFLIVWNNLNATPANIRGRLENRDGTLEDHSFTISSTTTVDLYEPAVAFSPDAGDDGSWLVVFWQDVSGDTQVVGRRVAADGGAEGEPLDICSEAGNQFYPALAYNGDSKEYLAVWADDRAGGGDVSVYGRRLDRWGQALDSSLKIATASASVIAPPMLPAVAASSDGYLVVYDTPAVYVGAQRLAADGELVGAALAVATPHADQKQAAVAYNSTDGQYLVVWRHDAGGGWDILGQRVDQDGTLLGPQRTICDENGNQSRPSVAYNPDENQYLVVWQDNRAGSLDIYGQRVNADGTLEGDEVPIAGAGAIGRTEPRVVYNPIVREYLVVYTYAAGGDNVLARRVGSGGATIGAEIPIATGANEQRSPDVACRALEGRGGYLVVWREADGTRDVLGQRLNSEGALLGSVLEISADETYEEWSPRLAFDPESDSYLVVWPDDRDSATQGRNIYGRLVGGAGALQDPFAISSASGLQKHAAVTYAPGLEEFVVTWADGRDSTTALDIYGQRVATDGSLVETTADENELFFAFSGEQESPAVVWGGEGTSGLVVWQDRRNGEDYDIYGRRLGSAVHSVYLPLVVREG